MAQLAPIGICGNAVRLIIYCRLHGVASQQRAIDPSQRPTTPA